MNDASVRRLVWVPIIHTPEDMGGLRELVRRHFVQQHGQGQWDAHVRAVEGMWREIRRKLQGLGLPIEGLRLYQDGLPVCGHEGQIVRDLARAGSANHRLLVDLMARGATLTGTESPQLLVEEYHLNRKMLEEKTLTEQEGRGRSLLEERDRFIARRIDETLRPGETGLIFLGVLHTLDGLLPPDIRLERLELGRPAASAQDPVA